MMNGSIYKQVAGLFVSHQRHPPSNLQTRQRDLTTSLLKTSRISTARPRQSSSVRKANQQILATSHSTFAIPAKPLLQRFTMATRKHSRSLTNGNTKSICQKSKTATIKSNYPRTIHKDLSCYVYASPTTRAPSGREKPFESNNDSQNCSQQSNSQSATKNSSITKLKRNFTYISQPTDCDASRNQCVFRL